MLLNLSVVMLLSQTPISKILIANRGEIACRVARTARAMGIKTVAVFSDADAGALHVSACDEALRLGPAPAAESYLNIAALLAAAKRSGADAVHPGYGFLSENATFAEACLAAGLTFIGPSAQAIAAMGNKAAAKRRMLDAGVACVPGYHGDDQSNATLADGARRIGFPVMVKAAAGGGGRGMRLVSTADDLEAALIGARSEAEHAFGSGELILEKAIVDARHVEIQVFADAHGHVIHLGERDCSVQRRHQKVIEEAPSPAVNADLRARMGAAAVKAAASIGYVGAGTVEFLLGADGQFYFLEMNTRLQVEHPVTELISGLDLVDWQIRVARGEPLPLTQDQVRLEGHAIEVRLYAEDPAQNFLPQSGDVLLWRAPGGHGVRVDSALSTQDHVSPHYDPMIAKIIAQGATRDEARERLAAAVENVCLLGIVTNQAFLVSMLRHPVFASGQATTAFIAAEYPSGGDALKPPVPTLEVVAVTAALLLNASGEVPEGTLAGWSSTGAAMAPVHLDINGAEQHLGVVVENARTFIIHNGETSTRVGLQLTSAHSGAMHVDIDGRKTSVFAAFAAGTLHLAMDGLSMSARDRLREAKAANATQRGGLLLAPMNGRVVRIMTTAGDQVKNGQCIVVLEAMKMQHEITAPRDGVLVRLHATVGQQVATRALLAEVE